MNEIKNATTQKNERRKKDKCAFTRVSFAHAAKKTILIVFKRINTNRV